MIVHRQEDPEAEVAAEETAETDEVQYQKQTRRSTLRTPMIGGIRNQHALAGIVEIEATDDVSQAKTDIVHAHVHVRDPVHVLATDGEAIAVEVGQGSLASKLKSAKLAQQQIGHLLILSFGSCLRRKRENKKQKLTLLHKTKLVLKAYLFLDGLIELLRPRPLREFQMLNMPQALRR